MDQLRPTVLSLATKGDLIDWTQCGQRRQALFTDGKPMRDSCDAQLAHISLRCHLDVTQTRYAQPSGLTARHNIPSQTGDPEIRPRAIGWDKIDRKSRA